MKKGEGTHTAGCADHIGNRHDRARFIIYHHDGDENRIRAEGGFQRVDRDKAFLVGLEVRDLEASCFQNFKRMEHGVVFNGGGDDMSAALSEPLTGGKNRPVVGFRAAGGEEDAVGLCTEGIDDGLAGGFQFALGLDPQIVNRRGVSPVIAE